MGGVETGNTGFLHLSLLRGMSDHVVRFKWSDSTRCGFYFRAIARRPCHRRGRRWGKRVTRCNSRERTRRPFARAVASGGLRPVAIAASSSQFLGFHFEGGAAFDPRGVDDWRQPWR
eukprot:365857-Chlamydomonas_euryale.AAC.4